MKTILLLEDDDVIAETDLVRQLYMTGTQTVANYSGGRINRAGWMLAREVCPAWVGKTLGSMNQAVAKCVGANATRPAYEVIRPTQGFPESHMEPGVPDFTAWNLQNQQSVED